MQSLPLDQILLGDSRQILASLPPKSVDLIFADPPYNLQLQNELWRPNMTRVDAVDDEWDRFDDFEAYDAFTEQWLSACRRVLKDTGAIWVIGSYHNIYRVGKIMMDLGYWILNDVVWIKCLAGKTEIFCLINGSPIITNLKDLARIDAQRNEIKVPSYDQDGCFAWADVCAISKSPCSHGLHITCDDGSWVACTPDHQFPTLDKGHIEYKAAQKLLVGGNLLQLRRFDMPHVIASRGIDEYVGNFIGWYLAQGNLLDAEDGVQLSMSVDEQSEAEQLVELIKDRFGIVGRVHIYDNRMLLIFSSRLIVALIQRFVRGHGAKQKRLSREAFLYGSDFLKGVLSGYLRGDGHWDAKNRRWRLGLCRNEGLIIDLQVISRLLGHRLRFSYSAVPYRRGKAEIIKGEIRENTDARWSFVNLEDLGLPPRRNFQYGRRYSIASIRDKYKLITRKDPHAQVTDIYQSVLYGDMQPARISDISPQTSCNFYDIGLKTNHVLALANGILTHNSNPMPQFRGVRFANAHETLIWAKKSREQKKYTFNYQAMKGLNDDKQMRSDWQLPLCTGSERIRVNGEKAHATQKPEALLYRVITSSSNPGDVVLDPFFGTGTTGAVARKLHRHWIGIERDPEYARVAQERIDAIVPPPFEEDLYITQTNRSAPRVPFGNLVEAGLLQPGDTLYLDKNKAEARVLADGTIRSGGVTGSIHRVGAHLLGLPALNGWERWYYRDAESGELLVIDALRAKLRSGLAD